MLKTFVKKFVVNKKKPEKNSRAAPEFIVNVEEDFKQGRARLSAYIYKTQRILI